jgi:diguanylate cyclase (GGDEF)-like protein
MAVLKTDNLPKSRILPLAVIAAAFILSIGLGYLDWLSDRLAGVDISFMVFYLIPAGLTAWYAGLKPGIIISAAASAALFSADILGVAGRESRFIPYWNAFAGIIFFSIFVIMIVLIKKELFMQKQLAQEDFLTKASNVRAFYNYMKIEMSRIARYNKPLTLVYLDIDDFKKINDTLGHQRGDRVLTQFVNIIRSAIRLTDAVARLGGDEFAIILPELPAASAGAFVAHIKEAVDREIAGSDGPITFSAGVVTFEKPPRDIEEMISLADNLMYEVKKSGKNNLKFMVYN